MWTYRLAGNVLGYIARAWRRSLRMHVEGYEWFERLPMCVIAVWHGRFVMPTFAMADRGVITMSSASKDGEMASRVIATLGLLVARGSTNKGGDIALGQMEQWLREGRGRMAALTVDGPRGPEGRVKRGLLDLARRLDVPIVPASFSAQWYWQLRSWDRMILAKPFSRCEIRFGPPIELIAGEPIFALRTRVKEALDSMTDELDIRLHGRSLRSDKPPAENADATLSRG